MKNKTYYCLAIILFCITVTSAQTIYAGENYTFQIDTTNNLIYTVVNNQSNMEGFSVFQDIFSNYSNITFQTVINFQPDNFTVILFDEITKEVEKIVYRNSGGGTRYIDRIEIQNETVYIPEYIYTNNTIEIPKVCSDIVATEPYKYKTLIILGTIIASLIIASIIGFIKFRIKKNKHL